MSVTPLVLASRIISGKGGDVPSVPHAIYVVNTFMEAYGGKLKTLTQWLITGRITFRQYHETREKLARRYLIEDSPATVEDVIRIFGINIGGNEQEHQGP